MDKCRGKSHFDTEFEATIGASKLEGSTGRPMAVYPCGPHFHITNTKRALRNKHLKIIHCDPCQCDVKVGRWDRHLGMPAHIKKAVL